MACQILRMVINFACFNCNGFKSFEPHIGQLLCDYDIICLQETMLTKQECATLNCVRDDCYGYGVSPVDASLRIIRGRPHGGVGFIWKKRLESNVSIIECEYDWLCCLKLSDTKTKKE